MKFPSLRIIGLGWRLGHYKGRSHFHIGRIFKFFLLSLLLAALPNSLFAAAPSDSTPILPPLIVTGKSKWSDRLSREASSLGYVSREELRETRGNNLEDVFQFSPGVFFQSRSGAPDGKLSIRGTNLSSNFNLWGVTILINGVPMGTADGFSNFEAIDLLAVDHLEVYKGAAALRYGGTTLGGAVNLVLQKGTQASRFQFKGLGGSYDFYNTQVSSGAALSSFSLGGTSFRPEYYVSLSANGQHGFRTNNQHDSIRLLTNLELQIGSHQSVRIFVANTSIATDNPGALTKAQLESHAKQAGRDPDVVLNPLACISAEACRHAEYTQLHYVGLAYVNDLEKGQRFTVSPFYQYWIHDVSDAQKVYLVNQDMGAELRYELQTDVGGLPSVLLLGFSPRFGESRTQVFINDFGNRSAPLQQRFTQTINLGTYLEGQVDLFPALTLIAGGRLVHSRREGTVTNVSPAGLPPQELDATRTFSALSPKLGFIFRSSSTAQLFGNVSRVYEPPINIQLIQALDVQGRPPTEAFIDVDAQRGWQFEVGFRGRAFSGLLHWDITAYDLELRNEHLVTELTIPGIGEVPTFTNAQKTRHTGVEVGGILVLARNLITTFKEKHSDELRLRATYTWSRYKFLDDEFKFSGGTTVVDANAGNTIPGGPTHWISGELRYEHPLGLWIAPNVQWSPEGYFVNYQNTLKNPPFFIVNIKAGWEFSQQWTFLVEGRNLTNQNYAGSILAGGGNNITARDTPVFYPSWPLSGFAGLEFQFN